MTRLRDLALCLCLYAYVTQGAAALIAQAGVRTELICAPSKDGASPESGQSGEGCLHFACAIGMALASPALTLEDPWKATVPDPAPSDGNAARPVGHNRDPPAGRLRWIKAAGDGRADNHALEQKG